MESGFTDQTWESINTLDASGRLVSKILKMGDYVSASGVRYRVPYCQPTDYASTPPEVWCLPLCLIPYGWWSLPAILHDAAFQNTLLVVNGDGTTRLALIQTESECNDLLLEAMKSIKPNPTMEELAQRNAIFTGVTVGGYHSFKEDRS